MAVYCDIETYRDLPSPVSPSFSYPAQWQAFVKDTKILYYKSHFRRCGHQCEQMLQHHRGILHPLHETFLYFYIAICNESLGIAAHKFSAKKLSLLNLAKDAFTSALLSLAVPQSHASAQYGEDDLRGHYSPSPALNQLDHVDEDSNASPLFEVEHCSLSRPKRNTNTKHSQHVRCDSGYDSESEPSPVSTNMTPDFNSYSARQPLALLLAPNRSSPTRIPVRAPVNENHDLIPQPLFIKKKIASPSKLPPPRPLPPLPTSSKNSAQRKPVIGPAKIMKSAPPPPPPPPAAPAPASKISHSPSPSQNLIPIQTPTSLSSFHTHLLTHLSTITTTISQTRALQSSHKLNQRQRLASFWSFKPLTTTTSSNRIGQAGSQELEARKQEKRERIERLRSEGWRVNKQRHGWKGEGYYEGLRGRAIEELG